MSLLRSLVPLFVASALIAAFMLCLASFDRAVWGGMRASEARLRRHAIRVKLELLERNKGKSPEDWTEIDKVLSRLLQGSLDKKK